MPQQESIDQNVRNWSKNLLVCTGFTKGEVIPLNGNPHPNQSRVLDYIEESSLGKILIGDACEISPYLEKLSKPNSAEVIGAWYNECVYNTARVLLEKDIPVRVNPSLTLCRIELHLPFAPQ